MLAVLTNRLYLGELTFRDTHVPQAHTPLIPHELFDRAHQLRTHRRDRRTPTTCTPSTSDFLLSGLLHCPHCHAAMVGTRSTGKTKTYRYYTCSTRARYSTEACNADRLAADALEHAVLQSLTRIYRDQRHLLHDAVTTAQHRARAQQHHLRAEHDTVTAERTRTDQALQRHLTAFEHGELDTTVLSTRVDELTRTHRQLATREQELTTQLIEPAHPDEATLEAITEQLDTVLATGPQAEAKAVLAELVATVRVTGPQHVVPVFRVPAGDAAPAASSQGTESPAGVRTVPHQRRRTGTDAHTDLVVEAPEIELPALQRQPCKRGRTGKGTPSQHDPEEATPTSPPSTAAALHTPGQGRAHDGRRSQRCARPRTTHLHTASARDTTRTCVGGGEPSRIPTLVPATELQLGHRS
ncbi:hypothetical protein GCM10027174_09730 [Salinifilum aidingensis]